MDTEGWSALSILTTIVLVLIFAALLMGLKDYLRAAGSLSFYKGQGIEVAPGAYTPVLSNLFKMFEH